MDSSRPNDDQAENSESDVADADRRNGDVELTEHPTGERQAAENRENDPPA